jgi:predicted phosphodiesterase
MPESLAEPWEDFPLGNGIKVAVLSDIHIPYHSPIALSAAVAYCKKRKPDVLLINGDLADFYTISRHQKDPSKRDLEQEITLVREGLAWLRHEFGKRCRIVLKLGNHEERWQHWLWNAAPEISSSARMNVSEWIDAPKYGVEVVADQRPIMCGRLTVMHGHELPRGAAAVNTARGVFLRAMSTMLVGHSHRTSQHSEPDWRHLETCCWSAGALCDLTPEYARIQKWNYGFAMVGVDDDGGFHVENLRMSLDGQVW